MKVYVFVTNIVFKVHDNNLIASVKQKNEGENQMPMCMLQLQH